jgi:atypical dual specificity phosphatase
MAEPYNFSWVDAPTLAAMGRPTDLEELSWLRGQGIEIVLTLTENPLRRDWLQEAGLLGLHVPVIDMTPPTIEQLHECVTAIAKAQDRKMGIAIHCYAGKGRTGTILAGYFVHRGMDPGDAIAHVRLTRPGSIETTEQEEVVHDYARSLRQESS